MCLNKRRTTNFRERIETVKKTDRQKAHPRSFAQDKKPRGDANYIQLPCYIYN